VLFIVDIIHFHTVIVIINIKASIITISQPQLQVPTLVKLIHLMSIMRALHHSHHQLGVFIFD